MLMLTALSAPVALLLLMLAMERVEQPFRVDEIGQDIEDFLDVSREAEVPPDRVENLVEEGYGPALDRYWRRRRMLALLRREG